MSGEACAEPQCTTTLRHHVHTDADGRHWCCGDYPYTSPASSAARDGDNDIDRLRAMAVELARHQGLRGPMDDERPDVWQNRCECGWDDGDERPGWRERYRLHVSDALLAGPLRQLVAERDEAVAAVQRVRAWVVSMDDLAREYREAAGAVRAPELIQQATNHAEDVQASADGVRLALGDLP